MAHIRVLPEDVRNFISCGEVIESPSSVVKELLENSIDSGATRIDVRIVDSGLSLISVTDDGCGIIFEELPLAVSAFSTSKINSKQELSQITTLGFRGEALASICNVASVKIFSSTGDAGGLIYKEADKLIDHRKFECPKGTTVEVRKLFFNAPVRKRFLKSEKFMKTEIIRTVQNYALSYGDVVFTLEIDGTNYIEGLSRGESMEDRIKKIFGFEGGSSEKSASPVVTIGFVMYPQELKPTRRWQFVFVNKRPVLSPVILRAVENATSGYFKKGRFPPVFISVDIIPSLVDVNVHPTKREVKFQSPGGIYHILYDLVKKKFAKEETVFYRDAAAVRGGDDSIKIFEEPHGGAAGAGAKNPSEAPERPGRSAGESASFETTLSTFETPPGFASEAFDWNYLYYVGVTHRKFLIFSSPAALHIIDFHASYERINYEKLKKNSGKNGFPAQNLLVPIEIKTAKEEAEILLENASFLNKLGITLEGGEKRITIKSLPAGFSGSEKEMLNDIVHAFMEERTHKDVFEKVYDNVMKLVACHMSKRAGDNMTRGDAEALLKELKNCDEPLRCPHGRPVMITLPTSKIESMLLRK